MASSVYTIGEHFASLFYTRIKALVSGAYKQTCLSSMGLRPK